ncbi:MAG: aminoacyl-tRNA hydrolase [Deltaproteobacteria bacterium]|nr:aminoacyl-tRNA hydrolase [Deltaproteobacteria bacterium]
MKLIAGLGNPGPRYQLSRHNFGFLVIDRLACLYGIELNRKDFEAHWGRGKIEGIPVLLAKPQTFMNLSGIAVQRLAGFFRVELSDAVMVHDDLDLPFATIRLKEGGGHGGHRGLMSVEDHLGGAGFKRLRLGIGRPCEGMTTERYVLQPFSEEEENALPDILKRACGAVKVVVTEGMQKAMNQYHIRDAVKINSRRLGDV